MLTAVLVANRGEIACRVIRTLRKLGIRSIAVYSDADARSQHVALADECVAIGAAPASSSYLDGVRILAAAESTGARGIHPGYGFLSENAEFAEAVEARGLAFIGPTPDQIRKFGLKHTARELASAANVPLLPGTGILADLEAALAAAADIGYPVMLKSTAGGGGIGLRLCTSAVELAASYESVGRLGETHFKHAGAYLEKYVARARHVEVQVFGDGRGGVVTLGERDCSLQRRNQKVVEETPAPNLKPEIREALASSAARLMESVSYRSAGTVEFIVDAETAQFYFLEVNTRLQVEHGVTEEVRGIDLVEWMVRAADNSAPPIEQLIGSPRGHSIQARIYAEDPAKAFQPSSGLLTEVRFPPPERARVDTWIERGAEVTPFYDPLIAKIVVWERLGAALGETRISGIETNLAYLRQVIRSSEFVAGRVTTQLLGTLGYESEGIDVLVPGTQSTVQDYPGRLGYWAVGIPPSGPMDALALRLGNRVLGNDSACAALELTMTGPMLKFRGSAVIALTGASMAATLDGAPVPYWEPVTVRGGQTLTLGAIRGGGARTYLAVRGGFDVPSYLGSRATFTLGGFGGHGGRALRTGDVLHVSGGGLDAGDAGARTMAPVPSYDHHWDIGVLEGPHAAPDFFAEEFIERFYDVAWKVHYNSARTGVRLVGPKPIWVRPDGCIRPISTTRPTPSAPSISRATCPSSSGQTARVSADSSVRSPSCGPSCGR
jgi:urea carboxylase